MNGIYEAYCIPGSDPQVVTKDEPVSATLLKDVEGYLIIGSSTRKFRIHYVAKVGGDNRNPWKVLERHVIGTDGHGEYWEPHDEFSSFSAARGHALRLARESMVR